MLRKLSFAAAVFGAVALSVAAAAPLGPQSGADAGDWTVSLVKSGKGGKGGKNGTGKSGSGKHHHRHRRGGGIYVGVDFCTLTAASCADRYGPRTRRYFRCLRNAGC
jgi:hypothetical protein